MEVSEAMNDTARRTAPAVAPPPEKMPPERVSLRVRPLHIVVKLVVAAIAVYVAAWLLPGVDVAGPGGALLAALLIAVLNVIIPPVVASLRLPFTLALGFLLAIGGDAVVLLLAAEVSDSAFDVDSVLAAILASLIIAAVSIALEVVLGTNDDDTYTLRVIQRIARRTGERAAPTCRASSSSRSTGSPLPVLRRAMRDGSAPEMARWVAGGLPPAGRVGDRPLLADRRRARRASCSARTRTSPPSAGSRRRRARS